jgi:hypothetical protein
MLPVPASLLLVNAAHVAETRARLHPANPALAALLQAAGDVLRTPLLSVTHKQNLPPSGDRHDYTSLGTYWWPNPETPDGLPYIRRDGERNPECDNYDSPRLKRLHDAVRKLAWGYYFTGDERFAAQAAFLLRGWFLDPATRMNPNLEFGQFIPGICLGRGIGIIDTATVMASLLDAILILEAGGALSSTEQAGLRAWMQAYRDWLVESPHGRDEAGWQNNHGTWYDVQLAAMELYLDHRQAAADLLHSAREGRIASQVEPDGRQPLELARTRSLSYSLMNATGFANLAALGERVGVDLWHWSTPDGRGLRAALDWLLPYVAGQRAWEGPQITPVDPGEALALYRRAAAAYGDDRYAALAQAAPASAQAAQLANLLF